MMEKQQEEKRNEREMECGRAMNINDIVVGRRRRRSRREYERSAERASESATEKPRLNAMYMEEMIASWEMCHRILSFIIHKAYRAA